MNKNIASLTLVFVLSAGPLLAMAGATVPPSAIPGVNQGGSESREEKADKKGEEASGSNSNAESQETDKDAHTSSGTKNTVKEPKQSP